MKAVFLGTSSMVPTKNRNVSSVFLEELGDCYLLDCGEGTQRQMNIAGINRHRVETVLISHWHGDHVSGLIGLLQTKDKVPEPNPIHIIGPEGSQEYLDHTLQSCHFNIGYDITVTEVPRSGLTYENDETVVASHYLDHSAPCVGFRVKKRAKRRVDMDALRDRGVPEGPHVGELQNGNTVEYEGEDLAPEKYTYIPEVPVLSYVVDTRPCKGARDVAREADTLIAEATFDDDRRERARKYGHMTASQAATLADRAGVGELYLTHFSQRFHDVSHLVEEAKTVFTDVTAAHDFSEVKISVSE